MGAIRAVCITVLGLLAPQAGVAGAWPAEPGSGQVILAALYDHAGRGFDAGGRLRDETLYRKTELSAFLEYGLTRRLTLVGRAALQHVVIEDPAGRQEERGLAASEIGLRAALMHRDWDVLSVQVSAIVPGAVENVADLRLGEGGYDYEARLLYGRSFLWRGGAGFAEAQAGWRRRSGPPPDEARLDLSLGWGRAGWMGIAQVFALHGSGATPPRRDYRSLKTQFSIVREIGARTRLQLGAFQTVAGRSIVRERAGFVGLWRTF